MKFILRGTGVFANDGFASASSRIIFSRSSRHRCKLATIKQNLSVLNSFFFLSNLIDRFPFDLEHQLMLQVVLSRFQYHLEHQPIVLVIK